jgi:hypothetical protein
MLVSARCGRHGDSIRVRKTPGAGAYKYPTAVYLIYIGMEDGDLVVRHMYRDNIDYHDIDNIEQELFTDAINDVNVHGYNFKTIEFKTQSYLTVVVDENNWGFYYPDSGNEDPFPTETHDPIVFIGDKTGAGALRQKNFAFYNCTPTSLENTIVGKTRNAVRCVNFFTKEGGQLIGNETFDYGFEIYIRVPFSATTPTRYKTIIIDPDGQNQGPP